MCFSIGTDTISISKALPINPLYYGGFFFSQKYPYKALTSGWLYDPTLQKRRIKVFSKSLGNV